MEEQREIPWTPEEWQAFQGHKWTQRRIIRAGNKRLFAEMLNIFNPRELREAQTVESPESLFPIVARTVYCDDQEHSSIHANDEIAKRVQGWTGVGWLKEEQEA